MKLRTIALTTRKLLVAIPLAAGLIAAGAWAVAAQNPSVDQRKEKKIAAGEDQAKRLLLLMDKDRNGKVSKQEFMSFMEAEFIRLDVNKDGELDVIELTQSQFKSRPGIHR
jgi:hypothetical protein